MVSVDCQRPGMYSIVPNHLIDRCRWDALVNESSGTLIYALSWYLDAVAPLRWCILVNANYTVGMPVVSAVKIGQAYAYQPMFAQRFSIFASTPLAPSDRLSLLNTLILTFNFVDIQVDLNGSKLPPRVISKQRETQELDLSLSYPILQKRYASGLKYALRKAARNHLELSEDIPIKEFEDFVLQSPLYNSHKQYRLKHIYLMRLIALGRQYAKVACWGVRAPDGILHCVAFFAIHKGSLYYLFQCGTHESRNLCAAHFLLDAMIKKYALHLDHLDFVGSNVASIAFFNKQFAATDKYYQHIVCGKGYVAKLFEKIRRGQFVN